MATVRSCRRRKPKKTSNPRPLLSTPEATNLCTILKAQITLLLNGNVTVLKRFQELHRYAQNLTLHNYGDMLYSTLDSILCDYLKQVAQIVMNTPSPFLIDQILQQWHNYKTRMEWISSIVSYMDKALCDIDKKKLTSHDLSIYRFKEIILTDKIILERLITQMLSTIQHERDGDKIDESLIRNAFRMLANVDKYYDTGKNVHKLTIGNSNQDTRFKHEYRKEKVYVYKIGFEKKYIEEIMLFHSIECQKFVSENGICDCLVKVEKSIIDEIDRVNRYTFRRECKQHTKMKNEK